MSSINSQFGVSGASLKVYDVLRTSRVDDSTVTSSREQELAKKLDNQLSRQLARIRTELRVGDNGAGSGQVGQGLDIFA